MTDLLAILPDAALLLRMALVALFVMLVALIAERLGPFLGGMLASLPLFTGPLYLMLALEHDDAYMKAATLGSIAICGATPVFVLAYCLAARRRGTVLSLLSAIAAWGVCATIAQWNPWSLVSALLFVTPIYAVAVPLARGFTRGIAPRAARQDWFDLLLRAGLCGGLSGIVITASKYVGPQLTGILSVLPILITSLILVLHPRIGGPATSALLAHTLGGLVGMVLAFTLVHLTIEDWGAAIALPAGLAVCITWNLCLIFGRRLFSSQQPIEAELRSAPLPAPVQSAMPRPPQGRAPVRR